MVANRFSRGPRTREENHDGFVAVWSLMGRYPVSELTSRAPPSYPAAPPVEVTLVTFFRKMLMRRDAANYTLSLRCRGAVASPAAPLLNIGDGCIDGADNFICAYAAFYGRCARTLSFTHRPFPDFWSHLG
jgi:hypothetical protein